MQGSADSSSSTPPPSMPPAPPARSRKGRSVWPIVVVVVIIIAGLGGGLYYYETRTTSSSTPSIVFSGWVSSGEEYNFDQAMVSAFNAAHTNVSVKFQPITTSNYYTGLENEYVAGNPPAVFYMENDVLPEFAHAGDLMNLGPVLGANSSYDLSGFEPGVINSFYFNSNLYAAPKDWSALFVLFNKQIFNEEHVAYPTNLSSWTWSTMRSTLVALKANESLLPGGGAGYYPMVIGPQFARILAFMHEAGGQWINPSGNGASSNSGGLESAIQFWYGLYSSGLAGLNSNMSAGWNGGDFSSGKVGMVVTGNWAIPVLNASGAYFANQMSDVGYTHMPSDTQSATMMFNVGLALNAKLTGTSLWTAEQFLEYFTGPVGEQKWVSNGLALPSRTAILDSAAYQSSFPIDYLAGSQFPVAYGWNYNTTNFQATEADCHSVIANLFAGKITPTQAYQQIIQVTNTDLSGTGT